MSDVFVRYADFYDLLYADKDYGAESDYLERLFAKFSRRRVGDVLDLGCGTGGHALELARRAYEVTGVDRSARMLASFRSKLVRGGLAGTVYRRDLRSLDLGRTFDAVVAMFAVLGYQTTNRDLDRALAVVARHLSPGGVFLADVWFGPAVLADPPADRVKIVQSRDVTVERHTSCQLSLMEQTVEVKFRTVVTRSAGVDEQFEESHRMRYFFPLEIDGALSHAGLELVALLPFAQLVGEPDSKTWNAMIVGRGRRSSGRARRPR